MLLFTLMRRNILRHRLRTTLTILGIATAIVAFGLLRTTVEAWQAGAQASAIDLLRTRNAVSLVFPLPLAYRDRIAAIPGVNGVSFSNWFGGRYGDGRSFFAKFAVDAAAYLKLYPEYLLPPEDREQFLRERNACIVGRQLATQHGWELGDTIRIEGTLYPGIWDFVIRGIYTGAERATNETQMLFHWQYLDERRQMDFPDQAGTVGTYIVRIADSEMGASVAKQVDALFVNSLAETRTESERAFRMGFVAMSGEIITALQVIAFIVIGIIALVLANTMAMAVRERTRDHAVLKALGFRPIHFTILIACEAIAVAVGGTLVGLGLLIPMIGMFADFIAGRLGGFFQVFALRTETVVLACGIALLVGLAAAVVPVVQTVRLQIAAGLRHIG